MVEVEDMEAATRVDMAATRADMVATRVTTGAIMEVMTAGNMEGLGRAQAQGGALRTRILVSLQIKLGSIAYTLARSNGR
jgi:hypothetical protein